MIPSQPTVAGQKPSVEVVVEGELSPFEDEALYRILRKSFQTEHPSYIPLDHEDLATRVNVTFHYPYENRIFTEVLRENWRDLKELFKQVAHRRGRAGAAFTLRFAPAESRVLFKSGTLSEKQLGSALDQIGHLTAIVGQMLRDKTVEEPIREVEASFDPRSDRWHDFHGADSSGDKYVFDESSFRWVPAVK